jgi:hypothetical protein
MDKFDKAEPKAIGHWDSINYPSHQPTIHRVPIMAQLWMNPNWINNQFHLDNPLFKK